MTSIKDAFVSRYKDGYLVEVDLSQIEIVILATLANDTNMLKMIKDGIDFHTKRLAEVRGLSYKAIKLMVDSNVEEMVKARKEIKTVSFMRSYGAATKTIAEETGLTFSQVTAIIDAEEKLFPEVAKYYDALYYEVNKNKKRSKEVKNGHMMYTSTHALPTGREVTFTTGVSPYGKVDFYKPIIKNYPVQGTAAEVWKCLVVLIFRALSKQGLIFSEHSPISLINGVHDSIMFDVADDYNMGVLQVIVEEAFNCLRPTLKDRFGFDIPVPLRYTVSVGRDWNNMKEIKDGSNWCS